jgi:hypothetical protein
MWRRIWFTIENTFFLLLGILLLPVYIIGDCWPQWWDTNTRVIRIYGAIWRKR